MSARRPGPPKLLRVPDSWLFPGCIRRRQWAVVICTGPSLQEHDVGEIGRMRQQGLVTVIAVNDAYRLAPWADYCLAIDRAWWRLHHMHCAAESRAERITTDTAAADAFGLTRARIPAGAGLGKTCGNSGGAAISLAHALGAQGCIITGMDMQATGGRAHVFGDHPAPLTRAQLFANWIAQLEVMADQARAAAWPIVNASRVTALTCFELVPLTTALDRV